MALTWAIAAAATPADIHSVVSAQKGPFTMYVAVTATQRRRRTGSSALANGATARLTAKSRSGIAVCQVLSRVRSEFLPQRIMRTEATPNGMELTRPVSMLLRPNDLMI